jgi:hypothetical protein
MKTSRGKIVAQVTLCVTPAPRNRERRGKTICGRFYRHFETFKQKKVSEITLQQPRPIMG